MVTLADHMRNSLKKKPEMGKRVVELQVFPGAVTLPWFPWPKNRPWPNEFPPRERPANPTPDSLKPFPSSIARPGGLSHDSQGYIDDPEPLPLQWGGDHKVPPFVTVRELISGVS